MNYTQSIGNIVELQCISKFIELGYECSIPYGNGAKYDFVADVNGKFVRVQCKSASLAKKKNGEYDNNAICIYTVSQTTNTQKTTKHRYTKEQIDYFATYWENKVYIIPVEECSTSKTLRFSPPGNGTQAYNKASDYEIEKMFTKSEELIETQRQFELRNPEPEIKMAFCKECQKPINLNSASGLCVNCHAKSIRTAERPSREELKKMIREESFTSIGKKYNVTDNAIRKWCVAENLPSRKKDIDNYSIEEWETI